MAQKNPAALKLLFETDDRPTDQDFGDFIDSSFNKVSDTSDNITEGTVKLFLTAALLAKINGIEAGATADQTGAEIATLLFALADTNNLTDALLTKLNGIESGAKDDQTGAEIKTAYEGEADTNAFTDAEKAKLTNLLISHIAGLQTELDAKTDDADLKFIFLDPTEDAAIITALGSATFTDDAATVAGWEAGRFYYSSPYLYVAYTDTNVIRIEIGDNGTSGSAFDTSSTMTRLVDPTSAATTTTGADGDPYVTAAVEAIGGMTITIDNDDPATNVGIKKLVANNYWEVVGADDITIKFDSDSAQGNGDKNASPRTGPWFWYVIIEFAGTISDDMVKMSAGGNKGIKLETIGSKATIKVNSTMLDLSDSSTEGGVSLSFKDNWTVGGKYLIAASKNLSGRNSAYLGTLSESTPGTGIEMRSTGQFLVDDFDNLDPAEFQLEFKAGTKIYEIGYLRGEADRSLIEDLFTKGKALIA